MNIRGSWQLFYSNLKILFRNQQALIWNVMFPLCMYLALSSVDLSLFLGEGLPYNKYLLPGILAFTVVNTGIYSSAFWLIDMRERGIIKRFVVTPLSYAQMLISLIFTRIVLIFFQVLIIGTVGLIFLRALIPGSILAIIILIFIGSGVFLSIGFIISSLANSYESAGPMMTATNVIFIVLGAIFVPITAYPPGIRFIAGKLPVTYLSNGLRDNFLYDKVFIDVLPHLLPLLGWLIAMFTLAVLIATLSIKKRA